MKTVAYDTLIVLLVCTENKTTLHAIHLLVLQRKRLLISRDFKSYFLFKIKKKQNAVFLQLRFALYRFRLFASCKQLPIRHFFNRNVLIFSYFIMKTYVVDTH